MRFSIVLSTIMIFCGCSRSPMMTGVEAENNRITMLQLQKGMSKRDVLSLLKSPKRCERYHIKENTYEVWFYLTQPTQLGQTTITNSNLTPLVFKNGILSGWGYGYYNLLIDFDNTQQKFETEKEQRYTDDEEEWPAQEHRLILPPEPKKEIPSQPVEKEPQKTQPEEKKDETTPSQCEQSNPKDKEENYHLWE